MAANAFDDLPPENAVAAAAAIAPTAAAASRGNAFDDLTPPVDSARDRKRELPPVTATDRAHALEGGVLGGAAYLATSLPDAAANTYELGKATIGTGVGLANTKTSNLPDRTPGGLYHFVDANGNETYSKNALPAGSKPVTQTSTSIPSWLQAGDAFPAGRALTGVMDRNELTSTQAPRPDDAISRYLNTAGAVVPGALAGGGGSVGSSTRAIAGALPSALAGRAVAEAQPFDSDSANNAASILAQALIGGGTPAATKALIRGPSGAPMQSNIDMFRTAGAEPSLAQAADTRRMQFLESGLSKVPGGAGVLQKAAATQADALRGNVDSGIESIAPGGVSPERAGRAINQGVLGEGGFRDRFNNTASNLYDELSNHIDDGTPVAMRNTQAVLDSIAKPNPKAPATSASLVNPKIAAIRSALASDVKDNAAKPDSIANLDPTSGSLPFSTLQDLRSRVGEMLTGSELVSNIPRAQAKRLYGGLSADMKQAAVDTSPDAAQAFSRADTYYKAGMQRMDALSDVLDKNGGPEQVFNSALSGTKDGATKLRAVMQSITPEQQQVVASTVYKRLGQATAGNQNAAGDVFSPSTFLTNYNRMSPEAKTALFDRIPGLREQADNLANVAGNLRDGSKVFKNASGTAASENQAHIMSLLVGSLVGGEGVAHFGPAGIAAAAAVPVGANLAAHAMTSPTVTNWAARPSIGSASQLGSYNSLAARAPDVTGDAEMRRRLMQALGSGSN